MKKVFIIAGEASGDQLGASVIRGFKNSKKHIEIRGIGGSAMHTEGLESLFPMEELSLMGIAEILPHIPNLLRRIKETAEAIREYKPDIVLTIDAPDFCFRVVKRLRKKGFTLPKYVHYVAPSVWAWRSGRAKKVAKLYDAMLCLFPFEPRYFEDVGMKAFFVGHPVMKSALIKGSSAQFREAHRIDFRAEVLGLFLGSRIGEIKRSGDVFIEAAKKWQAAKAGRVVIVPTLPYLREHFTVPDDWVITDTPLEKYNAFAAMDIALAKSGTTGLELAVCGVPHIIGYKMAPLTFEIVKRAVKTKYAHLVNIMLDRPIVPECIQHECTADILFERLSTLDNEKQKQAFQDVSNMLVSDISAAEAALSLLD